MLQILVVRESEIIEKFLFELTKPDVQTLPNQ